MTLRTGITTGTCAAAAAKAAVLVLTGSPAPHQVQVRLPGGETIEVPLLFARKTGRLGEAVGAVRKDAGDDPDVTHGLEIQAWVSRSPSQEVTFAAGEGVGTVTRPGLQVPPGEPAINPVPRAMISSAIREVTPKGLHVIIAIPGGREIAAKTFNPRLGIEGGLSILGTTGIVRPYCKQAMVDALKCALNVAAACGIQGSVLVPGAIGARGAQARFLLRPEQLIEVGNEWGFMLDQLRRYPFQNLLVVGHPGKLTKLAVGEWDTHSSRSVSSLQVVANLYTNLFQRPVPESPTVEGLFLLLEHPERQVLAEKLAWRIRQSLENFPGLGLPVAVLLINMAGQTLGMDGDFTPWKRTDPGSP